MGWDGMGRDYQTSPNSCFNACFEMFCRNPAKKYNGPLKSDSRLSYNFYNDKATRSCVNATEKA